MPQALQTVHGLSQRQLRSTPDSLLDLVDHLSRCNSQVGHATEGLVNPQHRRHLRQNHLPHRRRCALLLELRHEAEVGQRSDELVVRVVAAGQLPQLEQCLEAMQQLALSAHDIIGQHMCGGVVRAVHDKRLHQLVRLLHRVLFQELVPIGVVVHLLRLSAGGGGLRLRLGLRGLLLQLLLHSLLVGGAHILGIAVTVRRRAPDGLSPGLHVEELEVDLDGILGGPPVELVGVESVLHAEHSDVGLQGRLLQAVVVEVELVLGNVGEVLERLVELLQRLAVPLLPVVAPAHGRLVPHALHVVQVRSLGGVRLLRKEQRLRHAALGVVEPEHRPNALSVQVPVREVHRAAILVPDGGLLQVAGVPQDAGLAEVEFHQRGSVGDGAIHVLERLLHVP
mmetsp:Transcript_7425/g.21065  ORF Transcript_7425/g.21065 Transcript_7425/m.21065 type:complete len:395 (-) Transcript_7425:1532-2716(-)